MRTPPWLLPILALALSLHAGRAEAAAPLRVGIVPVADALPLYVAVEQGYLAAEGLDVQLTPLWSGPRIIEALAGGSLDIGLSATLSILQAVEQGLDLAIVAPASFVRTDAVAVNGLVVLKESGMTSAAALRGRTIGVNSLKSVNYLMTAEVLGRAGIKPEDVTWQEVPFPQMPAMLEQRRVDAVSTVEPFLTVQMQTGRAVLLSPGQDVLAGASLAAYTVTRSWYARNQRLAEAFARAHARGVEFCEREPNRARDILSRSTKTDPGLAQRVGLHLYRSSLSPADLSTLERIARRHRLLQRELNTSHLLLPTAKRP